ncbi:MAG: hypothetical protein A3G37_01400 [Omnitrophica WOR_2 bacterium RIFCSPLOWO2_12_FULL_46_30]|nr:MAG: hypothetical protein A3D27_03545 [Omnitrophica WOR_2 bacterium RIFCSPHIGHO2_02_FULL_46_37]OGX51418.1 MAG: hypothetical protein A3G37_01400 [Omnitrophica WOR_2 bacterium RIFCSPLOWO2_12_FULL_46_30]
MRNRRGVIATITVIFVLILIIMAGVALLLWTNHARLTERQIKRMRAFYTAEAAAVRALDELRRTATVSANLNLNNLTANVAYNSTIIDSVTAKVNY